MLKTCLACHEPFPRNETLEHFPAGRRIAFDPEKGRLWAVCPSCARWTLAPFDARWEALEELERLARDRARLLMETDNIGLLTAGDVELVRVGHAALREESWWRFGREFAARRKYAKRQALKGKIVDGAVFLLLSGVPFWGFSNADHWIARARKKRFGKEIWHGRLPRCERCGYAMEKLRFRDYGLIDLQPHDDAPFALSVDCPRCETEGVTRNQLLTGVHAEHILRRTLAYTNFSGGTERIVDQAVGLVEAYPSTDGLLRSVAEERLPLEHLTTRGAFALEIALNDDVERRLLEMELKDLEARWRREEQIAAIADTL